MSNVISLIKPNEFKFVIVPGQDPDPKYLNYYNAAYDCWHKVWSEAFNELNTGKKLHSDDFTRQTEVCCVFYGSTCVALLFLKWANFTSNATRNDSYFKLWSEEEFQQLIKYGPEVLIISNTTVAKEWRGKNTEFSMKDLILYFTIQRFLTSDAPAMTAVTRNTKGVDKLIERFGAVTFKENVPNHNSTDLVNLGAFYRKDMTEGTDPEVIKLGRKLWNEMLIIPRVRHVISDPNTIQKKQVA